VTERARPSPGELILLAALLVLGAALRWYGLDSLPWEQDELYTLRDAKDLGAGAARGGLPGIAARPVYYFLQHLLLQVGSATPFAMRLAPFAFGVAGLAVTWILARRLSGVTGAAVATLMVAVSPWHLYASQFARYWTLVYLLAAAAYLLLPPSRDRDAPGGYLATLAVMFLGALTHPTFVFPMVGFVLTLHLVDAAGRVAWRWPTRRAWIFLWTPLVLGLGGYMAWLMASGSGGSTGDGAGRGLAASLRLVPAMVQWIAPTIAAAAVVGILALAAGDPGERRRWGILALAGSGTSVLLLALASFRTDVYADYGMAALPLLYVSVGVGVDRLAGLAPARAPWIASGLALVLLGGVLPETASHLSDGTRFDYRPAFGWLEQHADGRLVVGWPTSQQRAYAPGLRFRELHPDPRFLEDLLAAEGGFWLVSSYHRRGLVLGGAPLTAWILGHCRTIQVTERPRLDYRSYRVELAWCGDEPVASGTGGTE
jgi:hypothetical protein